MHRYHGAAVGLVLALLAVLSLRQVGSLDAGFHLKAGETILAGGGWPRTDPFTYTVNDHPYIDTSWGYQVVLCLVQRAAGAPGMVLMHAGLVVMVFWIVARTARLVPVDPITLPALLLAGGAASEMRFEVRPELVSWLCLALVLHLLHRHAEGRRSPLWALAAIHLIWVNTHSLFILGWAAIACFVAGIAIRDRRLDKRLIGWGLASAGVTLINPYGWKGVVFPFTLATRMQEENVFGQSIGEFVSPLNLSLSAQFPFYPRLPIAAFRILAVLCLLALPLLLRRRKHWSLPLWLCFLPLAAMMVRNIPLLAIACLPGTIQALPATSLLVALGLRETARRRTAGALLGAVIAACILLGLSVAHDGYYIGSRRQERFGLAWNRLVLPIDAVRHANRVGLAGPMLNHLNFGGYLMWARPQPVFIDGRLEVMGEEFYKHYLDVLASEVQMEAAVSRYGIQSIIFPYAISPRLLARLSKDARWRLAYVDPIAVIFVRQGSDASRFVDPALSAPEAPPPPAVRPALARLPGLGGAPRAGRLGRWLAGLARTQEFPSEDFYLGLFHYFRSEMDDAQRRFMAAIRSSDGAYYEIYNNLGASLYQSRRLADAAACYRVVLAEDPGNSIARERLASIEAGRGAGETNGR